jgi:hypothetical protein
MQIIPVTVLDNFFEDPDSVREWALSLEYFPDEKGRWPGLRTHRLHELNVAFTDHVARRYFSLFYNFDYEKVEYQIDCCFQLIDSSKGAGWIHDDGSCRMTGIIYLTPNANLSGGTSIYKRKNNVNFTDLVPVNKAKTEFYLGRATKEQVDHIRVRDSELYDETIKVANVYNRLITFDSHLHHSAQDFFGEKGEDARLTLVFFVTKLHCDKSPVIRSRTIV